MGALIAARLFQRSSPICMEGVAPLHILVWLILMSYWWVREKWRWRSSSCRQASPPPELLDGQSKFLCAKVFYSSKCFGACYRRSRHAVCLTEAGAPASSMSFSSA